MTSPSARPTQQMPTAVLFDIDGTMIDSVDLHARAWQDALAHYGKDIPFAEVRYQIGKGGDQLMPVFLNEEEMERFSEDLAEWRGKHFKKNYLSQIRPFPQVRELFQRIKQEGLAIALASSAKEAELEIYKHLAHVEDLLEGQSSADDAERSKPHPDIFEAALEKLGNPDPAQTLVVGDTPYDAEAAGKAGLRTIGVLCGGFSEEDLRKAGCMAIYRDPADLLAQFDSSPLHRYTAHAS